MDSATDDRMADTDMAENSSEYSSIVDIFDQICFAFGDEEAIRVIHPSITGTRQEELLYVELQEYSKALAHQLCWRYRPDYVLVDCHNWPGAEIVSILACLRLRIPFIPVSCFEQHAAKGRLGCIVEQLQQHGTTTAKSASSISIAALTVCDDDQDPVLGVFQQANVHSILFLEPNGNLREPLNVPSHLSERIISRTNDDMYVMFTSGTSSATPKSVVGSQISTLHRIRWFQSSFRPVRYVGKRTPMTFVDAMAELLGTLLTRESVLIAVAPTKTRGLVDVGQLVATTECQQISVLPSQLSQLLDLCSVFHQAGKQHHPLSRLERIIVSGEPLRLELWRRFRSYIYDPSSKRYTIQLINLYGQTETTADCCGAILTELPEKVVTVNHTITIGKPLTSHITIHGINGKIDGTVTNSTDDLRELVVSGNRCFANGYLNPHMSSNGFGYENSSQNSSRNECVTFATGDMGFCSDGYWYVTGRKDDTFKINGVWTSPPEVETALLEYCRDYLTCQVESAAAATLDGRVYALVEGDLSKAIWSRKEMKSDTKLPWNLIPAAVFPCAKIPRTEGTLKIDRFQVKRILREKLETNNSNAPKEEETNEQKPSSLLTEFQTAVASVLGHLHSTSSNSTAVMSSSFVALGGDSALAVALHYQLRQSLTIKEPVISSVTPLEILQAERLQDIYDALSMPVEEDQIQRHISKRPKLQPTTISPHNIKTFVPEPIERHGEHHSCVAFAACVDIPPHLLLQNENTFSDPNDTEECCLVTGCQNGVVQRIRYAAVDADERGEEPSQKHLLLVIGCHHFKGCRISYPPLQLDSILLFCLIPHPSSLRHGADQTVEASFVAMTTDLTTILWTRTLGPNCSILAPPCLYGDILLAVASEQKGAKTSDNQANDDYLEPVTDECYYCVMLLNTVDGDGKKPTASLVNKIPLSVKVASKPIISPTRCAWHHRHHHQGDPPNRQNVQIMVCASSDWETGLLMLDLDHRVVLTTSSGDDTFFSEVIGPVHKDMVVLDSREFLVTDSWGSLHRVTFDGTQCTSIKLSNSPLSEACFADSDPDKRILVGCYDGFVYCVKSNLKEVLWKVDVQAVVYTKPLCIRVNEQNGLVVVCTTAGDILQLNVDDGSNVASYRIPVGAEIWSSPKQLVLCAQQQQQQQQQHQQNGKSTRPRSTALATTRIAFGARDSRLHILELPCPSNDLYLHTVQAEPS